VDNRIYVLTADNMIKQVGLGSLTVMNQIELKELVVDI